MLFTKRHGNEEDEMEDFQDYDDEHSELTSKGLNLPI